ncbi:MAG: V-type ATPase subunit [Candidatus Aminicenantaceae bacterium]
MKQPSRLDYLYSVGRVRVLEKNLVSKGVFLEAADEEDIRSVLKMIFDAGQFSEEIIDINDSQDLDDFLAREKSVLNDEISKIALDEKIEVLIDKANRPQQALEIAEKMGFSFFIEYFRHKIDLSNIKYYSRATYLGFNKNRLKDMLLEGGFLDETIFIKEFELSYTDFGEKLRATPYYEIWDRATDTLEEEETFVEFERSFEDFLMRILQKAKYIVFGPEPVFAYALAKQRELNLVRLLGIGKLNKIPSEILKKRISETYV